MRSALSTSRWGISLIAAMLAACASGDLRANLVYDVVLTGSSDPGYVYNGPQFSAHIRTLRARE